jgi:SAM-dependent methyltransferase
VARFAAAEIRSREACNVCGADRCRELFAVEGVASPVVACLGCGVARFEPMPSQEEIATFYPPAYYGALGTKFRPLIEWAVRLVGSRRARFLARGLAPGSRVLDVGCGRGVLLRELADRGFSAHGFEVSAEAVRGVDPRAETRVAARLADADYPEASFDQVILWHVLEHVRQPRETLEEVRRLLRPAGRVVVAVPNFASWQARWAGPDWFHLDPPRHLYHFPASSLEGLLARSGFRVDSVHHFSLRQNPFGWIQSAQNRWTRLPPNGLYEMLHQRSAGGAASFAPGERLSMWLWLTLGAAPALALSVLAALARRGATVHVVATRR